MNNTILFIEDSRLSGSDEGRRKRWGPFNVHEGFHCLHEIFPAVGRKIRPSVIQAGGVPLAKVQGSRGCPLNSSDVSTLVRPQRGRVLAKNTGTEERYETHDQ